MGYEALLGDPRKILEVFMAGIVWLLAVYGLIGVTHALWRYHREVAWRRAEALRLRRRHTYICRMEERW